MTASGTRWILAAAAALLSILVFPRFDMVFLAPMCLAPLLVALANDASWKSRFLVGWAAGFFYWFGVCYWIRNVLQDYGGVGMAGGWAVFLLFCLAKGLHWAAFAGLAGPLLNGWWAMPATAALWTGIERTNGPFGFAWLCLGNAGIDMGVPMRAAPFTGVYGVSFVFALMNVAIALVVLRRPRTHLYSLAALPLLFLLPAMPEPETGREVAVLVQPDVEEKQEWSREATAQLIRRMGFLSLDQAISQNPGPNLILWPEAPVPFYYESDPLLREHTSELARQTRSTLLFAGISRTLEHGIFNSAFLIDSSGQFAGRYDKMYLVPFGEFIPPFLGFVNKITDEAGDFTPGSKLTTFENAGHRIGVFICYESVFPHFVREFVEQGAGVLVNLSNDGYFGTSAAREQHLLVARMRAAENRRWLIRATNDGVSATVDPSGRLVNRLPPYRQAAARTRFSYRKDVTSYTKNGDWFAWTCLAAGAALALVRMRDENNRKR